MIKWTDIDGKVPDCTLGKFMDMVFEETGRFPDWDEEIPEWVYHLLKM